MNSVIEETVHQKPLFLPPIDVLLGISYCPPLTDPFFLSRDSRKTAYRIYLYS